MVGKAGTGYWIFKPIGMKHCYSLIFFFLLAGSLAAQLPCEYKLQLHDSFGDGWNGASLTLLTSTGGVTTYTFTSGYEAEFTLSVTDGIQISFIYAPGNYENEVSYTLLDADGLEVFSDGPFPAIGPVFTFAVVCPTCPVPPPANVSVDDVRAFTADISWTQSDPNGQYLIEYDTTGFTPGTGLVKSAPGKKAKLTGLMENTEYEFYLSVMCANGDTSHQVGPYPFKTLWAKNVGIVDVVTPTTGCNLSSSTPISVTFKNFGGSPQSLFEFYYSVNGDPGAVNPPTDGFYTGILGKDSLYTMTFDASYDFSEPGEYIIQAWTALQGDSETTNDTFTVKVVSIPTIESLPYYALFEEWSEGWLVNPESLNSSWEYGHPSGPELNVAASGNNIWATNLDGSYNNTERGFLESPCFDFSGLTEDPVLSFSLWLNTEFDYDGLWVDVSRDGGETWEKLGTLGEGINWYNHNDLVQGPWWSGAQFLGWTTVRHTLNNVAGNPSVRLRLSFFTDGSVVREGVGVDNIYIAPQVARDIQASSANHDPMLDCGGPDDIATISIVNLGTDTLSNISFSYQVNGGNVITENVDTLTLLPNASYTYTFDSSFDSSVPGDYLIKAWASVDGDLVLINDTINTAFSTTGLGIPYVVDFEQGNIPAGWVADTDLSVTNGHNNSSFVLYDNLWSSDQTFMATMPLLGLVEPGDSLLFDYRVVDFSGSGQNATVLGPGSLIKAQVSTDCGESYTDVVVINDTTHITSTQLRTMRVSLDEFAGFAIKIRFMATWASGDYYLDLDNIFLKRCPASLNLSSTVKDATGPENADGSVTISPAAGQGPFTYSWSNGGQGNIQNDLMPGEYTVQVSDKQGCTDQITVSVSVITDVADPGKFISSAVLAPNPTTGETALQLNLVRSSDLSLEVFNSFGQRIMGRFYRQISTLNESIDLNDQPSGIYFLRLFAEGEVRTLRLIKSGN